MKTIRTQDFGINPGKCSRLGWCEGMRLALRFVPANFNGKGLTIMTGWLPDDAKGASPRCLGVSYRRSRSDDGLVLNFCPWCGSSLEFHPMAVSREPA
jgi:hypothetical protein